MANHRKEPTYTSSFRFNKQMKDFFASFEPRARNLWLIDLIKQTKEFREFEAKEQAEKNTPPLFEF